MTKGERHSALRVLLLLAMVGALGCRPAGAAPARVPPLPTEPVSAVLRAAVAECERLHIVDRLEVSYLDGAVYLRCTPLAESVGTAPLARKGRPRR